RMLQLGGYGRFRNDRSRLDGAVTFGSQHNKTSRSVSDGLSVPTTNAIYDGASVASQLEYGFSLAASNTLSVEPQVCVQYARVAFDGATESGAGPLSLIVPDRTVRSERSLAGARVAKSFAGGGAGWTLEGRGAWAHEFMPIRDVRMRF